MSAKHVNHMSDKQKSFWSGTIVTAMVVGLTGLLTWGLLNAAKVPVNEAKNEEQFKNLNSNLEKLTSTNSVTNKKLDNLSEKLGQFANALVITQVELKAVKEDCDYNTNTIRENAHNHKNK